MATTLAHELVHWHAISYWERLPAVVEEGVAHLMSRALNGVIKVILEPPTGALIDTALSMGSEELLSRPFDESLEEIARTGMWIVASLGLEELRSLAQRADEQGRSTIPPAWFLERLPATRTSLDFDPISLFPDSRRPLLPPD